MKRAVLLTVAVLFAVSAMKAQTVSGSITVRKHQDLVAALPQNVAYLFPQFHEGVVDFTDGTSSSGLLNICNVDNSVRFVNEAGDTLLLSNAKRVARVIIDGYLLMKTGDGFLKQTAAYGQISLCERKRLTLAEDEPEAGYSGVPATSMAKMGRVTQVDSRRMETGERNYNYRLRTEIVLWDGEQELPCRMSSFTRIFPAAKKSAKSFVKEHRTDFQDIESVAQLFLFCTGQ